MVATTTTAGLTGSSSVFGQAVAFNVAVRSNNPSAGIPIGSVQLLNRNRPVAGAIANLNSAGAAGFNLAGFAADTYQLSARYSGGGNFTASSSPTLVQTVAPAAVTATIETSNPSVFFGQGAFFTAIVAAAPPGAGVPTGSIQPIVDGQKFGEPVPLRNGNGRQSFTLKLAAGAHTIQHRYTSNSGNFRDLFRSSPVVVNVAPASTTARIATSTRSLAFGQTAAFTASVVPVPPGAGTPTGLIQPIVDGAEFGAPIALRNGAQSFSVKLGVGTHTIQQRYVSNSGNFTGATRSAPAIVTVSQARTTTTASLSRNTSVFGQPVVYQALVKSDVPGAGTPTGSVQILNGRQVLATANVQGDGRVNVPLPNLGAGRYSISSRYSGSGNFFASSSPAVPLTVGAAATRSTIATTTPSIAANQPASFIATVAAVPPGAGKPTGSIQVIVDGKRSGSPIPLRTERQTFTLRLAAGGHTIQQNFISNSGNFASAPLSNAVAVQVRATRSTAAQRSSLWDNVVY